MKDPILRGTVMKVHGNYGCGAMINARGMTIWLDSDVDTLVTAVGFALGEYGNYMGRRYYSCLSEDDFDKESWPDVAKDHAHDMAYAIQYQLKEEHDPHIERFNPSFRLPLYDGEDASATGTDGKTDAADTSGNAHIADISEHADITGIYENAGITGTYESTGITDVYENAGITHLSVTKKGVIVARCKVDADDLIACLREITSVVAYSEALECGSDPAAQRTRSKEVADYVWDNADFEVDPMNWEYQPSSSVIIPSTKLWEMMRGAYEDGGQDACPEQSAAKNDSARLDQSAVKSDSTCPEQSAAHMV